MINQIAAASEEQSSTSEQISRSVEGISTISGESARGIAQIAESSDGLSRLTEDLRGLIARFKLGAASQAASAYAHRPAAGGDGYGGVDRSPEPHTRHTTEDRQPLERA